MCQINYHIQSEPRSYQQIKLKFRDLKMFSAKPISLPSSESSRLIKAIRDQADGISPHLVYVIDIVSVKFGGYFTAEIKTELQKYRYLQMLTLNDCGIVSLENFPILPALIRLDMVFNSITGEHLNHLIGSKHIQTLMLGANKIDKLEHLIALKPMHQLLQLDMINNPVQKVPGYREQVFSMFKSLSILDTLDKAGKDAYTNSTMMQAVSRVPDGLFDKSMPVLPPPPIHPTVVHKKATSKLKKALARTGSLDSASMAVSKPPLPLPKPSRGKYSKLAKVVPGRSRASKAGLLFPVGRLRRKLKQTMVGMRIGQSSSVYMAAILEYLTAQLVEISGNVAKRDKKRRIVPSMIKRSLKQDEEMNNLLRNVTIGMTGE